MLYLFVLLVLAIIAFVMSYGSDVLLCLIVGLYGLLCLPVITAMPWQMAVCVEFWFGVAIGVAIRGLEYIRDSYNI